MNREPLIHWHLVNHNGTLRDPRGGVTHKRSAIWYGGLHLRNNGPGPVEGTSLEWKFDEVGMVGASFKLDPHAEDQVEFAVGLPWVGAVFFGVSLRGWAGNLLEGLLTDRAPGGGRDKEVSVRFFDEAVWWNLWHPRSGWSSTTPRWRSGSWHPLDTLFGRGRYSEVEGTRTEYVAELALPEGSYPVKVTMTLNEWKRDRLDWFFARRRQVADVEGRIPMPRKGPWRSFSVATDEGLNSALGNAVVHIVQHRYGWTPSPREVREVGGIPAGGETPEVSAGGVVVRSPPVTGPTIDWSQVEVTVDGVRLDPGDVNFKGDEVQVTASATLPGTLDHVTAEAHVEAEPDDQAKVMTVVLNPHRWAQPDTPQSWANAFEEIGMWAMHKAGAGPGQCERCMRAVPCISYEILDVLDGNGPSYDHEYWCPTHGSFGYGAINGMAVYQDDINEEPVSDPWPPVDEGGNDAT